MINGIDHAADCGVVPTTPWREFWGPRACTCGSALRAALQPDPTYDEVIAAAAPVTRPDLDALIAELEEVVILGDDPSGKELARRAMDALAAERVRANEAETTARVNYGLYRSATDDLDQAEQRIADAPHEPLCPADKGLKSRTECTCWKSAAPAAEQGADQ